MGLGVFTVLVLFVAVMIWRVVQRGYQMKALVERGAPVTGEVVNKVNYRGTSRIRSRHLRYRFRAGDGQEYGHRIVVGSDDFQRFEPGQPIELVYLPDNPKVSAQAEMVELARAALSKKTGVRR